MAKLVPLQNNWKRGMKQDIPRTAMPDGTAWNLLDFIPAKIAPLEKRGGWEYGSDALPTGPVGLGGSNKIAEGFGSASSVTTTATLTPQVDALYLATVSNKCTSGTPNVPTLTGGGGLTWVQVATALKTDTRVTLFRALKSTGLTSGTLTADFSSQTQDAGVLVTVAEFTNVDPGGTNGSAAVVQSATANGASTGTLTVTLSAFSAATNGAFGAFTHTGSETTPESGYSELSDLAPTHNLSGGTEWKIGSDTSVSATWTAETQETAIACEIAVSSSSVTPDYVFSTVYAPFKATPRVVAIGDNAVLYIVNPDTLAVSTVGAAVRPLQTAFHNDKLILPSSVSGGAPLYFDGNTTYSLGGPSGKYACMYKDRTILANTIANPTYLYFSDAGDPTTWDTTNSWLSVGSPVTGLASLPAALMVFQEESTARIRGSTPPPDTDMIVDDPVFNIGCTDARSIAVSGPYACFCNPTGIYLTNGTNQPTDVTEVAGFKTYWTSLFTGYDPETWTIAGGFYQNNYVVSVMNGTTFVDGFCINLDTYAMWRISNLTGACFASAVQIQEELWFGLRDEAKLATFSTVFSPAAAYKQDGDGTDIEPVLETPIYGTDPSGVKTFRSLYLGYDCRDAASDDPILTVSYLTDLDGSYTAMSPTFAETTARDTAKAPVDIANDGIAFKVAQTNSSSLTRLFSLDANAHARERSRLPV
jgi:hypothetical protein